MRVVKAKHFYQRQQLKKGSLYITPYLILGTGDYSNQDKNILQPLIISMT